MNKTIEIIFILFFSHNVFFFNVRLLKRNIELGNDCDFIDLYSIFSCFPRNFKETFRYFDVIARDVSELNSNFAIELCTK